jgi:MoaA/NifB/PqqE/SkfB family radical SAM enzyme
VFTDIKVGFTCNNKCVHCVIEPIKSSLICEDKCIDEDTNTIKKYIDEACLMGSKGIVLTGGEVTIRNDFKELLMYGQQKGLKVTVQTNGRMLSDRRKTRFLHNCDPVQFVVAIHGPNNDLHNQITRRQNSFEQTIQAIQNLLELKNHKVVGKTVISRLNMGHLPETIEFCNKIGVKSMVIAFPHAEEFPVKVFNNVVPRYRELTPIINKIFGVALELEMKITLETVPYCIYKESAAFWTCNQDIQYSMHRGEDKTFIRSPSNSEINHWDITRPLIKRKGAKCGECLLDKVCEGPWHEYIDAFGDEEFIPLTDPDIVNFF